MGPHSSVVRYSGIEDMKKNIPKTLDVFRGNNKRKADSLEREIKTDP